VELISVDPGDRNMGYVVVEFDEPTKNAQIKDLGVIVGKDAGLDWILAKSPNLWIVEDYKVDPRLARRGRLDQNQNRTSKQIGAIELRARQTGSSIHLQSRTVKPVGYGFAGMKYTRGASGTHMQDALAHMAYYLVQTMGCSPGFLRKSGKAQ